MLSAFALTVVFAAPATASMATSDAPPPTDAGGIGMRLLDIPAAASDDPRARIYIVDHLDPGAVIHRRIEVTNTTASTAPIVLYPAAAAIGKGAFLIAAGHTPNDVSTWTSVVPDRSDIPAGGRLTATVTITVPHDAAPGERYGVVWAEARSDPTTGRGITQVSRVGIRLYPFVGPGGPPAADMNIDSLTAKRASDGRPMVVATVHNTGGRALDMSGSLELSGGPAGLSAGPFPALLGVTLAIGDTEPVTISLDKRLPAGPWDARITLRSGLLERSARATITFPDTGAAPPVNTTSTRPGWLHHRATIAVAAAAVVLVPAVGAPLVLHVRKLRRR